MTLFTWLFNLLASLFGRSSGLPEGADPAAFPELPARGDPAWLKLARAELGTKEIPGPNHNPAVLGYFRDAGFPEINNDETAWCAGFTNAMIERSGYSGSKSLAARSFLNWGKAVAKPYPGCIAVFSRGDPRGWEGHVGFFLSETDGQIMVLGGNQGNEVSIEPQPRARLLGFREPVKASNSRTYKAATLGIVSAGATGSAILDSQTQIMGIVDVLKMLGTSMPQIVLLTSALSILAFLAVIWARWDDNVSKGR